MLSDICRYVAVVLLLCIITTPCQALTFFQADYDADEWTTETVYKGDWLPLRELSSILPYTVEWKDRTICIYADRTWTIQPDRYIPEGMQIVNGVTYVTPEYMKRFLPGVSFVYGGELYVFVGETKRSRLVQGDETFRRNALTALYRIKLALPEDYRLIRNCLTGGIAYEAPKEGLLTYSAYIYPAARRPTAYIVSGCSGADLAELIAHEAYHVYLHRQGRQSEDGAINYGRRVKQDLLRTT